MFCYTSLLSVDFFCLFVLAGSLLGLQLQSLSLEWWLKSHFVLLALTGLVGEYLIHVWLSGQPETQTEFIHRI